MRNVMVRAWEIAKEAAAKFGGSAKEYIAGALRMAWKEVKAPKYATLELRAPNRKSKTWVAAIVGTHPLFKFERKFINSDSYGEYTWTLNNGIYDVCENGKRYFIRVANGDWSVIDEKNIGRWI